MTLVKNSSQKDRYLEKVAFNNYCFKKLSYKTAKDPLTAGSSEFHTQGPMYKMTHKPQILFW